MKKSCWKFFDKLFKCILLLCFLHNEINAKCVMHDTCSTNKKQILSKHENPFDHAWLNCESSDGEPRPLATQRSIDDFKRICSPLYDRIRREHSSDDGDMDDDALRLCCSDNQIQILKRDIGMAEALIGACPSCFLNFRTMWCHLTCDPNQSDFIVPLEFHLKNYVNFTQHLIDYEQENRRGQHEEAEEDEKGGGGEGEKEEEEKEEEGHREEQLVEEHEQLRRKKRQKEEEEDYEHREAGDGEQKSLTHNQEHEETSNTNAREFRKRYAIGTFEFYLSNEFALELVNSCK